MLIHTRRLGSSFIVQRQSVEWLFSITTPRGDHVARGPDRSADGRRGGRPPDVRVVPADHENAGAAEAGQALHLHRLGVEQVGENEGGAGLNGRGDGADNRAVGEVQGRKLQPEERLESSNMVFLLFQTLQPGASNTGF